MFYNLLYPLADVFSPLNLFRYLTFRSIAAFLTALVLYSTMTGLSPLDVPTMAQFPVDANTQAFLRDIADQTVRMLPPRMWCPSDPLP